jgi:hypothetical protein
MKIAIVNEAYTTHSGDDIDGLFVSDWKKEGRPAWDAVALEYARPRPCAPEDVPLTASARRRLIAGILGIAPGDATVAFTDYAGRTITKNPNELCAKLSADEGHAGYVGWIAETFRNPIEVWNRLDNGTMKLHYYSAYADPTGYVLSYMAVSVTADGTFVTAFQKNSAAAIDNRRNGTPVFCSYGPPGVSTAPKTPSE